MRPAETFPYGTTLRHVAGGYRIHRPGRSSYGRVFVRLINCHEGQSWRARCDAWDGFTWSRDRTISRLTIAELEDAVRDYVRGLDNHARACELPALEPLAAKNSGSSPCPFVAD